MVCIRSVVLGVGKCYRHTLLLSPNMMDAWLSHWLLSIIAQDKTCIQHCSPGSWLQNWLRIRSRV